MGRSLKKGPFVDAKLMKKVLKQKESNDRSPLKTWSRRCTVVPEMVNHTFEVHNGKNFQKVFIVEDMVGHKLGEFSVTRVFRGHTQKKAVAAGPGVGPGGAPPAPGGKG